MAGQFSPLNIINPTFAGMDFTNAPPAQVAPNVPPSVHEIKFNLPYFVLGQGQSNKVSYLTNPYFTSIPNYSPPSTSYSGDPANYYFMQALKYGATHFPQSPILVVDPKTTTPLDSDRLAAIVKEVTAMDNSYDLFYLSRWMDRCNLLTEKKQLGNTGITYATTQYPQGLQAIIISPQGRDRLLGKLPLRKGGVFINMGSLSDAIRDAVYSGNLSAKTTVENLINFNILQSTDQKRDSDKTTTCMPTTDVVTRATRQTSSNTWQVLFWIALVIIIILIVVVVVGCIQIKRMRTESKKVVAVYG